MVPESGSKNRYNRRTIVDFLEEIKDKHLNTKTVCTVCENSRRIRRRLCLVKQTFSYWTNISPESGRKRRNLFHMPGLDRVIVRFVYILPH